MIYVLIIVAVLIVLTLLFIKTMLCETKELYIKHKIPNLRILNEIEAEWMADYFFNKEYLPDYDGYVGNCILPDEVMKKFNEKYKIYED